MEPNGQYCGQRRRVVSGVEVASVRFTKLAFLSTAELVEVVYGHVLPFVDLVRHLKGLVFASKMCKIW